MNLQQIAQLATDHFNANEDGGYFTDHKMQQYALEELGMSAEDAEEFMLEGNSEDYRQTHPEYFTDEASQRFFIWYFFNEMIVPAAADLSAALKENNAFSINSTGEYLCNFMAPSFAPSTKPATPIEKKFFLQDHSGRGYTATLTETEIRTSREVATMLDDNEYSLADFLELADVGDKWKDYADHTSYTRTE